MPQQTGLTFLGKALSVLLIAGLVALGGYLLMRDRGSGGAARDAVATAAGGDGVDAPAAAARGGDANTAEPAAEGSTPVAELKNEVPRLAPPAPYQPRDNTIEVELSEYAGYAGLIAANGGLTPTENSVFFKKHGFKVKLSISEEESWSALNSGKMAASATTADVLAVYGRQLNVVVPAQIGFSRGADGIVVRTDVTRINGLKGKRLATSQFTEAEFFIRYLAQEAGLQVAMLPDAAARPDPEKVNLVFYADAFAAGDAFLEDIKSGGNRLAGCVTWAPKTTEVADESGGKAHVLTTNRNLLIVADILIVNRGFAQANPKMVHGLVDGLLQGNQMVRNNPDAHLGVIAAAFNSVKDPVKDKDDLWDDASSKDELSKVHLSNLPESLAFFGGSIDWAGSFGGIYQSAVLAYGSAIREPVDSERFVDLQHLRQLEQAGTYRDQRIAVAPIRTAVGSPLETDPLLSKDIRFFFEANSAKLDMQNAQNGQNLGDIKKLLQVSPGSKVLLRGHVDNAKIPEFRRQGGEALVRQGALSAMQLSKDRAAEIRRLLIEQHKVEAPRLETVGRGWEEPVGTESEKNRRVEVYWYTLE